VSQSYLPQKLGLISTTLAEFPAIEAPLNMTAVVSKPKITTVSHSPKIRNPNKIPDTRVPENRKFITALLLRINFNNRSFPIESERGSESVYPCY